MIGLLASPQCYSNYADDLSSSMLAMRMNMNCGLFLWLSYVTRLRPAA